MSDFMAEEQGGDWAGGEIRKQRAEIVRLQDRLRVVERDRQQFADLLNDVAIALDDVLGITNRIGRTPAERVKYLVAEWDNMQVALRLLLLVHDDNRPDAIHDCSVSSAMARQRDAEQAPILARAALTAYDAIRKRGK